MAQDVLGPLLVQMLNCAKSHLSDPVGRVVVMPGNSVVYDDCCAGQLWIRIISIVGASALSQPAMQPCAPLYQIRCGLGVVRCAHTVNDQGKPPTPAEMAADAFQTYRDRADLTETIACCYGAILDTRGDSSPKSLRIEDWLPTAADVCVGGEITFTFNHILCAPCDDTECF